jgi:hypothetical protein
MDRVNRPGGITVMAILQVIIGVAFLLAGLGSLLIATITENDDALEALGDGSPVWLADNYQLLFGALGLLLIVLAVVAFALAYGFLRRKGWSWTFGLGFAALDIVGIMVQPLISFDLTTLLSTAVALAVPVVIIYYLTRFQTRAYFGKL